MLGHDAVLLQPREELGRRYKVIELAPVLVLIVEAEGVKLPALPAPLVAEGGGHRVKGDS